jgi:hypothetical protein
MEGGVDKQLPAITVYVQFPVGNLRSIPRRAEGIASQILSQAGVAIRWQPGMKAHWTDDDIVQMGNKPLALDPLDIFLIRKGLLDYTQAAKQLCGSHGLCANWQTCHFVPGTV